MDVVKLLIIELGNMMLLPIDLEMDTFYFGRNSMKTFILKSGLYCYRPLFLFIQCIKKHCEICHASKFIRLCNSECVAAGGR